MPTDVQDSPIKRAVDGLVRSLKEIKQAEGYNTTPRVVLGAQTLESVPDGHFPLVAVEMGDLAVDTDLIGGASTSIIRWRWPAFVWGYVTVGSGRAGIYDAGFALLTDILGAIYSDEGLTDGNGQYVVHLVEPGEIVFDMESFAAQNRGYFLAEFQMVFDTKRSGNP